MKSVRKIKIGIQKYRIVFILCLLIGFASQIKAQDVTPTAPVKPSPVKYTFEGNYIGDNQTTNTLFKKSLEFIIQHRFGVVTNGYKDFYGIYAPSNIRLGLNYGITKDLMVGVGFCKDRLLWDGNVKYAVIKQTPSVFPVSVTYYGNFAVDTRDGSEAVFVSNADRVSYFNQILIARKVNKHLSLQVAPSYTHLNNVEGYLNANKEVKAKMLNDHFSLSCLGRYKLNNIVSVFANYDQPLTVHPMNNPQPNISFGLEMSTGSHTFQIFAGNYSYILQQNNNYYNINDYSKGQFLIGFNITRRWDFE